MVFLNFSRTGRINFLAKNGVLGKLFCDRELRQIKHLLRGNRLSTRKVCVVAPDFRILNSLKDYFLREFFCFNFLK